MNLTLFQRISRLGLLTVSYFALLPVHAQTDNLPPIKTVFIILMENNTWPHIKGNPSAPYINSLLPMASHCEQYFNMPGVSPSEPNYLWLEAGTNFGVQTDDDPYLNHQNTTNHLVTLLNNTSISWKAYDEDISGTNVPLQSFGNYVARHNPFVYFDDVTGTNDPDNAYGIAHIRPFTELAGDLATNNIASYNFITPNICDDMHDACAPLTNAVLQGDNWLSNNLPVILNSRAYEDNGAIFITWDESETPGLNPIGMIVLSPWAKSGGYFNQLPYNHSSTLRTMQDIFGVTNYLGDAANATNLSDLFWPPGLRLTGLSVNSGAVQMNVISAAPGKTNIIESSTNLVDWIPVGTNYSVTNYFSFSNTTPTNPSRNFYRVVQLP